jgi:hypothetical protein
MNILPATAPVNHSSAIGTFPAAAAIIVIEK